MLPYKRSEKVSHLLRQEIADIIMNRLKEPRLGFLSIIDVEVSDDLKIAHVYVSVLKEEERDSTIETLNSARGFIRKELSSRLKMKFIPTIDFRLDTSIEKASRIHSLLRKLKEQEEKD